MVKPWLLRVSWSAEEWPELCNLYFKGNKQFFKIKISGLQVQSMFLEERVSVSLSGPAGGRLQPSCLCVFFSFVLPPQFASFPSRVGHVAAKLSWHGEGRTDYVCLQSLITSLRIDYYSCSLGSRGSGRGSHSNIQLHRCCARVNVVVWPEACLPRSDRHLCDGSVAPCLSYLIPQRVWMGKAEAGAAR